MKTIYTDRLGIYPWVLLFLSFMMFWWAYEYMFQERRGPFGIDGALGGIVTAFFGSFWLYLAAKRFRDVRRAKLEGRDPTII